MRKHSRRIRPQKLGIIGEDHVRAIMIKQRVDPESITYNKVAASKDGLPYMIEVAFGLREENDRQGPRYIVGLNWSAVFKIPTNQIRYTLSECRVDSVDPVVVFIHQAEPRLPFIDHGKGSFE